VESGGGRVTVPDAGETTPTLRVLETSTLAAVDDAPAAGATTVVGDGMSLNLFREVVRAVGGEPRLKSQGR